MMISIDGEINIFMMIIFLARSASRFSSASIFICQVYTDESHSVTIALNNRPDYTRLVFDRGLE